MMRCCRNSRTWTGSAIGVSRRTLRFNETAKEDGFLRSRQEQLASNLWHSALALAAMAGVLIAFYLLSGLGDAKNHPSQASYELMFATMTAMGSVATFSLFLAAALKTPALQRRMSPAGWEWVIVATLAVVMCIGAVVSSPYSANMLGHTPQDVWPDSCSCNYEDQTRVLLTIDGFVTASHLMLPIRWRVLVLLEALAGLIYPALVVTFGTPNTFFVTNAVMICGLIIGAGIGKRAFELHDRVAFCDLVAERSLRCEAEFQLEQANSSPPGPALHQNLPQDQRTNARSDSVPETTSTGEMFDQAGREEGSLEQLAALGKKEHWLLEPSEVKLMPKSPLGQGGFGFVVRGAFCNTPVAVKLPLERRQSTVLCKVGELCNEIRVLRQLRHPNIVLIHGAVVDQQQHRVGLVLEFVRGRTLAASVDENELCIVNQFQVVLGLCCALVYLQSRRPSIVHGDLKASNIMVERMADSVRPKLLDFGLSRIISRRPKDMGGTVSWMAPEVYKRSGPRVPRCSADVFSYGLLVYYVTSRRKPPLSHVTQRVMAMTGRLPVLTWPREAALQPHSQPLVECCVRVDEALRPGMQAVHEELCLWPEQAAGLRGCPGLQAALTDGRLAQDWQRGVEQLYRPRHSRQEPMADTPAPQLPPTLQPMILGLQQPNQRLGQLLEDEVAEEPEAEGAQADPQQQTTNVRQIINPRLVLPHMVKTRSDKMVRSVLDSMARWNFVLPARYCCPYHEACVQLERILGYLQQRSCQPDFVPPDTTPQCGVCGLLALDPTPNPAYVCDMCGDESGSGR